MLNKDLQNTGFQSWRLGSSDPPHRTGVVLPGCGVAALRSEAIDYVHTRASVTRNHLVQSHGRLFCFLEGSNSGGREATGTEAQQSSSQPHGFGRSINSSLAVAEAYLSSHGGDDDSGGTFHAEVHESGGSMRLSVRMLAGQ